MLDTATLFNEVRSLPIRFDYNVAHTGKCEDINTICAIFMSDEAIIAAMNDSVIMNMEQVIQTKRQRTPNAAEYDKVMDCNILFDMYQYAYLMNTIVALGQHRNEVVQVDFQNYWSLIQYECRNRINNLEQEKCLYPEINAILRKYENNNRTFPMRILSKINARENDYVIAGLMTNVLLTLLYSIFSGATVQIGRGSSSQKIMKIIQKHPSKIVCMIIDGYIVSTVGLRIGIYSNNRKTFKNLGYVHPDVKERTDFEPKTHGDKKQQYEQPRNKQRNVHPEEKQQQEVQRLKAERLADLSQKLNSNSADQQQHQEINDLFDPVCRLKRVYEAIDKGKFHDAKNELFRVKRAFESDEGVQKECRKASQEIGYAYLAKASTLISESELDRIGSPESSVHSDIMTNIEAAEAVCRGDQEIHEVSSVLKKEVVIAIINAVEGKIRAKNWPVAENWINSAEQILNGMVASAQGNLKMEILNSRCNLCENMILVWQTLDSSEKRIKHLKKLESILKTDADLLKLFSDRLGVLKYESALGALQKEEIAHASNLMNTMVESEEKEEIRQRISDLKKRRQEREQEIERKKQEEEQNQKKLQIKSRIYFFLGLILDIPCCGFGAYILMSGIDKPLSALRAYVAANGMDMLDATLNLLDKYNAATGTGTSWIGILLIMVVALSTMVLINKKPEYAKAGAFSILIMPAIDLINTFLFFAAHYFIISSPSVVISTMCTVVLVLAWGLFRYIAVDSVGSVYGAWSPSVGGTVVTYTISFGLCAVAVDILSYIVPMVLGFFGVNVK